ncbi:MAG TPA: ammonium transporter, partial [Desulfobulbus sp.]|nr:ammonium transporter [Desulfobulbus sp.]
VVAAFAWAFGTAFILFKVIDITFGLRVTEEEELEGVDIAEHAAHAYNDFQVLN